MNLLAFLRENARWLALGGLLLFFGAGLGLVMQVIVLAVQNAVDPREAARGVLAEHFDPTAKQFLAALGKLYPQAPELEPGMALFALHAADGTPIMVTDSREAAVANAMTHELETVSVH